MTNGGYIKEQVQAMQAATRKARLKLLVEAIQTTTPEAALVILEKALEHLKHG
jgi:hypothetical protein